MPIAARRPATWRSRRPRWKRPPSVLTAGAAEFSPARKPPRVHSFAGISRRGAPVPGRARLLPSREHRVFAARREARAPARIPCIPPSLLLNRHALHHHRFARMIVLVLIHRCDRLHHLLALRHLAEDRVARGLQPRAGAVVDEELAAVGI